MLDIELHRHLLALRPPWSVTQVDLALPQQRDDVGGGHAEGVRFPCPECGTDLPLYDHSEPRVWRHLDSCQFLTYVHARSPRVRCPDHGIHQVEIPWPLPTQRDGIEASVMDMEELYVRSTRAYIPDPDAKIVFDRYHVMSRMGSAVDAVRKQEQRALRVAGVDLLTGSKYLWLNAEDNLPEYHRDRFAAPRVRPEDDPGVGSQGGTAALVGESPALVGGVVEVAHLLPGTSQRCWPISPTASRTPSAKASTRRSRRSSSRSTGSATGITSRSPSGSIAVGSTFSRLPRNSALNPNKFEWRGNN